MTLRTFSEIAGVVVGRVGKRKSYADGTGDPVRALSYDVDDRRAQPWVRLTGTWPLKATRSTFCRASPWAAFQGCSRASKSASLSPSFCLGCGCPQLSPPT